jgi:hypothetical protein
VTYKNLNDKEGDEISLKGQFAGHKVRYVNLYFYMDKLCYVRVIFRDTEKGFSEKLLEELTNKYGRPFPIKNGYTWDFDYFKGNSKIERGRLDFDFKSDYLVYIAPKAIFFSELQMEEYDKKMKNEIKIKQSDL